MVLFVRRHRSDLIPSSAVAVCVLLTLMMWWAVPSAAAPGGRSLPRPATQAAVRAVPADGTPTTATGSSVAGGYEPFTTPDVVLDTAHGVGGAPGPIRSGSFRRVAVGSGLLPSGAAESVVVQLSLTANGRCFLRAYADAVAPPAVDPLEYANNPTTAVEDQVTIAVTSSDIFDLSVTCTTTEADGSPAGMTVRATVDGFYRSGRVVAAGALRMLALPAVADSVTGLQVGRLSGGITRLIAVAGQAGVPADAQKVLLNISVLDPYSEGSLTVRLAEFPFAAGHAQTSTFGLFTLTAGRLTIRIDSASSVGIRIQVAGYLVPGIAHGRGTYADPTGADLLQVNGSGGIDLRQRGVPADATALLVRYFLFGSPPDQVSVGSQTLSVGSDYYSEGYLLVPVPSDGVLQVSFSGGFQPEFDLTPIAYVQQGISFVPPDGDQWSKGTAVDSSAQLYDLSCVTRTFCMALGADFYELFDGLRWSAPIRDGREQTSLSCTSSRFCMAVGDDGSIYRYDGTTWTKTLNGVLYGTAGQRAQGVACVSSTACLADVDLNECSYNDDTETEVCGPVLGGGRTWNGSYWGAFHDINSRPAGIDAGPVTNVTCIALTACRGQLGYHGSGEPVTTAVYDGTMWIATTQPATYATSCGPTMFCADAATVGRIFPTPDAGTMSCASPTFCYLAGLDQIGYLFNGTVWSRTKQPLSSIETPYLSSLLSCPATGFCVRISFTQLHAGVFSDQRTYVLSRPS